MKKVSSVDAKPYSIEPRQGSPTPRLEEHEFKQRFLDQFQDKSYDTLTVELERVASAAWDAYAHQRKSPDTQKAGNGYKDPTYDLSLDWIAARDAIRQAEGRHCDPAEPLRVLLINGSSRSEQMSPTIASPN